MLERSNYNQKTVILELKKVAREEKIYINNIHNETRVNYEKDKMDILNNIKQKLIPGDTT